MKLTVEENRETIKRYGHIKAAPKWGSARCCARCPGVSRSCTREEGHNGPHVAHGMFKKVVAVWEAGTAVQSPAEMRMRAGGASGGLQSSDHGLVSPVKKLLGAVSRVAPSLEAGLFLIFFLAMVGFVIDWTLRLLGLR